MVLKKGVTEQTWLRYINWCTDLLTFQCQHISTFLLTAAHVGTPRSLLRVPHWCKTVLFLTACYQPLKQFISRNSRCTIIKRFQDTLGITATEEDGLLHSWTLSPHKHFWLLVVQDTIVICLRYMIATGAATHGDGVSYPVELSSFSTGRTDLVS